jgi:hypothetical protein
MKKITHLSELSDTGTGAGISRRAFVEGTIAAAGLIMCSPRSGNFGWAPRARGYALKTREDARLASVMQGAAVAFLNSLPAEAALKAKFSFEDDQRFDWHYVPRARKGVPFKDLDQARRQLANALLSSGLNQQGFAKAATIMSLEDVLRDIEKGSGPVRDAELYYFSLFGDPKGPGPWGWRVEGHHLSLNFTVAADGRIASTPCFFGSNPAEVRSGPRQGLRTLAGEEDLARAFLKSLNSEQRASSIISNTAPSDILTTNSRTAALQTPAGVSAGKLGQRHQEMLMGVISYFANNMAADIAASRVSKLRGAGFGNISFAWAGGLERGQPHYYRIQGPTFLIEYDNTQNDANHIHTVWRDFSGDFGADLLGLHYKDSHR